MPDFSSTLLCGDIDEFLLEALFLKKRIIIILLKYNCLNIVLSNILSYQQSTSSLNFPCLMNVIWLKLIIRKSSAGADPRILE